MAAVVEQPLHEAPVKVMIEDVTTKEVAGSEGIPGESAAIDVPISSSSGAAGQEVKLEEKEETGVFKFDVLEAAPFPLAKEREQRELHAKWGLDKTCEYRSFRFDERFTVEKVEAFLQDFFSDPVVCGTLRSATTRGDMVRGLAGSPGKISYQIVPTTQLRMDMFTKLKEEGLVSEVGSGRFRGCMPEVYDGVESGTLVREMILNEDSEYYYTFEDHEKKEFLFRIFQHYIIGGGMCQPDESVEPYLKATKDTYKALLSVKKHAASGQLKVQSVVVAINDIEGMTLFPRENDHNLCYVIIDPLKRKASFWSNAYVPLW